MKTSLPSHIFFYHIRNIKQAIMTRHETSMYKYANCCSKSWPCGKCGLLTTHSRCGAASFFLFSRMVTYKNNHHIFTVSHFIVYIMFFCQNLLWHIVFIFLFLNKNFRVRRFLHFWSRHETLRSILNNPWLSKLSRRLNIKHTDKVQLWPFRKWTAARSP